MRGRGHIAYMPGLLRFSIENESPARDAEEDVFPDSPGCTAAQIRRDSLNNRINGVGSISWFPTLNTGNEIASAKWRSSLRGKLFGAASQQLPDRCGLARHDLAQTSLVSGKTKAAFRARSSRSAQPQVFRPIDIDESLSSALNLGKLTRQSCGPVRVEFGRQQMLRHVIDPFFGSRKLDQ